MILNIILIKVFVELEFSKTALYQCAFFMLIFANNVLQVLTSYIIACNMYNKVTVLLQSPKIYSEAKKKLICSSHLKIRKKS